MRPTDEQLRVLLEALSTMPVTRPSKSIEASRAIVEELLERRAVEEEGNFRKKLMDAAAETTAPIVFDWRGK
jgi:hypothetical protein